jgi:hypothetical protein
MGTPIDTPLTSEIWHLTIDDLLEPLPASPRLGGPGPFVINLSASTAPISVPMKAVADHPGAHVYQVQRTEDRRVRYRLRLGPFETEAEAEALLSTVREIYPSALTASAEPDDLRSIEAIKNKIEAQQLAAVKAAVSKAAAAAPPLSARPVPARTAQPEAPAAPPSIAPEEAALPTTPPPAWLALRAEPAALPAAVVEIDVPLAATKPAPKPNVKTAPRPSKSFSQFAPARWSPVDRAFVPTASLTAVSTPAPVSAADKAPAACPAPRTAAAPVAVVVAPVPAEPPARSDVPTVGAPPESLIPVLSESVAVPRPAPASRPAAPPAPAAAAVKVSAAAPPAAPAATVAAPTLAPPLAAAAPAPAAPPVAAALMLTPPAGLTPPATLAPVSPASPAPPPAAAAPAPLVSAPSIPPIRPAATAIAVPVTPRAVPAVAPPASRAGSSHGAPRVERFDTTQTLRPLTPKELEDASALRWFVIQLSCAEEGFDPDSLPNLDIFSEYRLYSVKSLDQGKLLHSLRLGFFSEESHAKAVAGYLRAFYDDPAVKRVSAAERTRFEQNDGVEARKDIGATGNHAVIEITDERIIRPKRSGSPAVPPGRPPLPNPPPARSR